jgi:hypothetical protein
MAKTVSTTPQYQRTRDEHEKKMSRETQTKVVTRVSGC